MKKEIKIYNEKISYTIGRYLKESKQSYNKIIDFPFFPYLKVMKSAHLWSFP
jgi:hypothetical protein